MRATIGRRAHEFYRAVRCQNRIVSRYVFNAGAVRDHRRHTVELSTAAAALADRLIADGVAAAPAVDVVGDPDLVARVRERAADLYAAPRPERDPLKPYLFQLLGENPELRPDDPLLQFALDPQIRGIAERYCGMRLRVQDLNVWVNEPTDAPAQQSQRWHRDVPEDHDIVKCFFYLSDVTPAAGPMSYVAGTNTHEGRRVKMPTQYDGGGYRLSNEDVAEAFPAERTVTAAGPAGTVIFADTLGVHRGGHATGAERVVLQITYGSHASLRRPRLRPAAGVSPEALPDVRLATV
jgi:hypothetical protein